MVKKLDIVLPDGSFYGSPSPKIGGFNELVALSFPHIWIMQHLDCSSEQMFPVYFDSRISAITASHFFFEHMRTRA